ncbi:MAG: SDR family NAD(P)-dependent oxidoreductase [Planctomycetota bacterium]
MSASFVEVLQARAEAAPERLAFRFLAEGGGEDVELGFAELDRRARALAARLVEAGAAGERVLLLSPPGPDNVVAFFACLYAGAIAVPLPPPRRARADGRLRAIRERSGAAFALADDVTRERVSSSGELPTDGEGLRWLASTAPGGEAFEPRLPGPDEIAFLQFTSGSTGRPKGVRVSHGNLIANARLLKERFGDDEQTVSVTWLPPYHDMGLIGGLLQPVFLGSRTLVMSPASFIRRPLGWLEAISRYRATTCGGPNFAYGLCADAAGTAGADLAELDLSAWTLAFCGAEPVRAATLARFARAFEHAGFDARAFYPCYGMAETTLFVSGGVRGGGARRLNVDPGALERGAVTPASGGRAIVACGSPAVDALAIVDRETGRALPERAVGEVWVRGAQVAKGYWDDASATAAAFGATLAGVGGYLRTGDLGFLDAGELFLTGRAKDLIVLRGRNLDPSDLEETAAGAHAALGTVAAFSVEPAANDGGEQLVLVAEVTREARRTLDEDAVGEAVRRAIVEEHGADPLAVVFLRPGALERTSSGKLRRAATRAGYLADGLSEVGRWQAPARTEAAETEMAAADATARPFVRDWLVDEVARAAGLERSAVDPGEPWASYGLDSVAAVQLVGRLSDRLGREVSPTVLFDYPTIGSLADHLTEASPAPAPGRAASGSRAGIAVIGVAARFPGGDDAHGWFDALTSGVDATGPIPADRPGADAWREAAERTPAVANAGFLADVDATEIALFGLSPREAESVDPQQRLLLETAWRAFEDAGLAPEQLAGTTAGVFVGVSSPDYARLMAAGGARTAVHAGTGNALSVAANRISYRFDLRGPSVAVDTACSSSLVAVHQACASLERGEAELALAGGVNLLLAPDLSEIFAEAGMLSPGGRCRTFDAAADGYVRGEGCGLVVLKDLARAQADGDRVLAVIRGSAINQDGRSNGLTAPNGRAQEAVIRAALARAGRTPDDVDYVEAHGTGTSLGDPIEAEALLRVFGGRAAERDPLRVGSVKTNVGHLEAAAGIAGLIKVVLALAHGRLPGQLHFAEPNPLAPVERAGAGSSGGERLAVLTEALPWTGAELRAAGVSSFGFGGTNAHVIVEGAPPVAADPEPQQARGLWLSERAPEALAELARAAAAALDGGAVALDGLAREAAAGRARLVERVAVVADNADDASRALRAWASGERPPEAIAAPQPPTDELRIAFAFPGQGAQRVGMGAELYTRDRAFRRRLDGCERVLREAAGFSLLELLQASGEAAARRLAETRFTQPALFAVELCLAEVLVERGARPELLIGHSVGEYAAACLAGVFDREDALRLVARRAELVAGLPAGGAMLAVGLPAARAQERVAGRDDVSVAVDNGPTRSVLSGAREPLERIAAALAAEGVEARWLTVSHAFHSPLLDPIVPAFEDALAAVTLRSPRIELVSNVSGDVAGTELRTPAYWARQLREQVRFREGLAALFRRDPDALVEVGPRATSLALARAAVDQKRSEAIAWLPTLRDGVREDLGVVRTLAELFVRGAPLDGRAATEGVRAGFPQLPGVRFRRERHWFVPGSPARRAGAGSGHPLLGASLDLPESDELRFEARLSTDTPAWLGDHRVGRSAVLPAAAYAEIAIAAAGRALGAGALELRDLTLSTALTVPDDREARLHTVVKPDATGVVRLRVLSAGGGAWVGHAEASVAAYAGHEAPQPPPDEVGEPNDVDLEELRGRLDAAGLRYGEAFRGLERLALCPTAHGAGPVARGTVRRTPRAAEERYGLPPTRLDACLQCIAPLVGGSETLLPVGVRRLVAWPTPAGWPERVEVRAWLVGPTEANLDVRAPGGQRIVALEGVSLAPAPGLAGAERSLDALHTIEWIRRGRAGGSRARLPEPERVVERLRAAFAERLAGEEVRRYRAGVDALERRARSLAHQLAARLDDASLPPSTKNTRLAARIRALAAEAPLSPAEAPRDPAVAAEADLLERCGARALDVLAGTCDPIAELLFPGGDASALRRIYRDAAGPRLMNAQVAGVVEGALNALDRDEGLTVLELGAGTGATTEALLDRLPGERTSYLFTDVGAPLVQAATERLGPRHPRLEGRVLDASRDPAAQGFAPGSVDVAIAANVLHATPRLVETLAHVRSLLAPGGWLVLLEGTRRLGWLDLTFGLTEGWWCFEADEHRADHPLVDTAGWARALADAGFVSVASLATAAGAPEQDVVVARAPERAAGRIVRVVAGAGRFPELESSLADARAETPERGDGVVIASAFDTAQVGLPDRATRLVEEALGGARSWLGERSGSGERLTFVTHGAATVGDDGAWAPPSPGGVAEAALVGVARALRLERPGLDVRVVDLGDGVSAVDLASELVADDPEDEVALRSGGRFVPRLAPYVDAAQPVRLEVAVPGHLDQLVERPAERFAPGAGEVEVEVRATGLNFRDLLQALGMLGRGYAAELGQEHIPFGFECAGEVARVGAGVEHVTPGDAVVACFTPGSLASHVTLPARFVVPKPSALDWARAAALPTAWLTVWHALDDLARLAAGEWVLIHAAAGGVGTAAVRHALTLGARVIATAHPSKWEHLRALGVERVASSRDAGFAERVREWTGGAGADVVLNCLADELALASLAVTSEGGRFVELGRVAGVDAGTAARERPDVRYHAFDLGQLALEGRVDALVRRFAEPGAAERLALPTETFPFARAEDAFRRLQAGRHVGKLVLERNAPEERGVRRIDGDGCYVLSGGTGGLGLAVAGWLADRGARHVALLARRAPAAEAQAKIDALVRRGVRVDALAVDVADRAAVRAALAGLRDGGASIRGVVHGAGVLADGLLADLDGGRVRRVLDPKVRGADSLAAETASDALDFFVSFSSAAALFGSPGQANHAAANAVLDAHAARLRGDGRPGQSLAWGAWARIGAAARKGAGDRLAGTGIGEIEPTDGLAAFGEALRSGVTYLGVAPVEWARFAAQPFAARPFYARRLAAATAPGAGNEPTLDLSGLDGPARRDALQEHVRTEIATVLGLASPEAVEPRGRLMDLGMDSLMAVELKARLERSLGLELQATLLFDHPTVEALVAYLDASFAETVPEDQDEAVPALDEAPAPADDAALLDELAALSDEDALRRLRG